MMVLIEKIIEIEFFLMFWGENSYFDYLIWLKLVTSFRLYDFKFHKFVYTYSLYFERFLQIFKRNYTFDVTLNEIHIAFNWIIYKLHYQTVVRTFAEGDSEVALQKNIKRREHGNYFAFYMKFSFIFLTRFIAKCTLVIIIL